MGFNQEILPVSVLSELYPKSLVLLDADRIDHNASTAPSVEPFIEQPKESQLPSPAPIKFLGNNSKKVVLVVDYKSENFLPDEQLQFLTKILGACKLNLGDVAIVNHGKMPTAFENIKKELAPAKIVLFGVDPSAIKLPIQFPDFKAQSFSGCVFLKSPAAEQLNQETEEARTLKMQLWNALKQIFQL